MGVLDRYNEKKKKKEEESKSKTTSGGVADRYDRNQYYLTLDTDSVDDNYINSFISDTNSFFSGVNDKSISYSAAKSTLGDLSSRYDTIQGWLYKNKRNLNEEAYTSLSSTFDGLKSNFDSINDFYSQWDSDESYQASVRQDGYKQKYSGMSWEEVQSALRELSDGEEKQWLSTYQYEMLPTASDFDSKSTAGWEKYLADQEAKQQAQKEARENESFWDKLGRWLGPAGAVDTSIPLGNAPEITLNLRNDYSYREPKDDWTDEQRATFGYLYDSGAGSAKYAQITNEANSQEENEQKIAAIEEWATQNGWTGSAATLGAIAMMPLSLADTLSALTEYNARGFVSTSATPLPGQVTNAITGAISTALNEKSGTISDKIPVIGGKGLGDAYQLGTSIANSMISAYTQGSVGTYMVFFGSASSSGMYDAKNRGASDAQAITLGILQGLAEAAGEALSVEHLLNANALNGFFANVLMQAGIEASEEGVTTLLNNFSEQLVMGDKSNFNVLVSYYMTEKGLSEDEAKKKAWLDMANDLAFDMFGGAISGGVSSGLQTGVQTMFVNHAENKKAQRIYGSDPGALVNEALEINPDNAFAQKMQGRLDAGKNLSGGQLNRLVKQNEAALTAQDMSAIQSAAESRLTELGETGDVSAIAAALTKQAAGKKLSSAEQKAIANSKYGQRVANELNADNIQSGNYSSEWAQKLDTNRINAEEYSRLVEAAQLPQEAANVAGDKIATEVPKAVHVAQTEPVEAPKATAQENRTVETQPETVVANDQQVTEDSKVPETKTVTIEEASKKYGAQAQAMIHTYTAGQDVAKYDQGYQAAYDMGKSGVAFSYLEKNQTVSYLTDSQKQLAYEAGQAASNTEAKELDAQNRAAFNGKTGRRKGVVKGEGVTIADLKKTFNDTQGKAYKYLSTVAEVTGIDIVLYRSEAGADGKFQGAQGRYSRSEPGTIYIDLNAGLSDIKSVDDLAKYAMLRTFSHKFTHFIEKWNPIQYNEFRKVVFDTLTQRGENVHDLIEDKQARNPGMSYDKASREVVAEAMTDILPDANFVQELAENHKNIFQKLIEKLKEFVENLRDYYNSIGHNRSKEANALKEQVGETVKYLDSIVQLFDNVAMQAVENYQNTVATEETTQESEKLSYDGKAALLAYKSGGSYQLNTKLREGIELKDQEQAIVDGLDDALPKLPVCQGTVYRNIGFDGFGDQEARDAFIADHPIGEIVSYKAYTSASTRLDGYTVEGDYVVHLIIDSVNGRDLEGYGNNFESEVLFSRDSSFITDKIVYDETGTPTIYLTEVANEASASDRGRNQKALSSDHRGQQEASAEANQSKVQRLPEQNRRDGEVQSVPDRDSEGNSPEHGAVSGVQGEVKPQTAVAESTPAEEETNGIPFDKRTISHLKSAQRVFVTEIEGKKYVSDAYMMLATNNTGVEYAKTELHAKDMALPDMVQKALSNATTLLTEAPMEGKSGGLTIYEFTVGEKKLRFNKKLFSFIDGGLLYYTDYNGGSVIKSVNEDGSIKGYLLGMKINDKTFNLTDIKPSKLKSFSNKMQELIDAHTQPAAEPVVQGAAKDQRAEINDSYSSLEEQLKKYTHVDIDGIRYSAQAKKEGGYYGNIKRLPAKAGGVPVENSRATIYSSYTPGFATREEAIADLMAVARNAKLLGEVSAKETTKPVEEVTINGKESENGTDARAVHEPVRGSEGPARLLEGVEPETVQGSDNGRQPVQSGSDQGADDAGRDGRADAAGSVSSRSTRNRVGGDIQQLPDAGTGTDRPGTGLSGTVQEERNDHDRGRTERLDGERRVSDEAKSEKAAELHEEVQREIEKKSTVNPKGSNFVIGDSLDLPNGTKARTRANIEAIKLVKQISTEGRIATPAEQEILSKYVGWGGLADAFGKPVSNHTTRKIEYEAVKGLETEFEELKSVLTEEEYKSARESTKNAHYTSIEVIKAMYDGLKHLGFIGGRMLEPSSGVGNFVGAMPADMTAQVKSWTMVELDNITGMFAKYLYPNADVRIQGFEEANIPDGYMDVAIGNVPFGNYAITDKHYPKAVTSAIHNYFFAKSLDKVRTGGLVMFITSAYTMNSRDSAVRKYIMQRADLLGAIRLPNTAFSGNAGTSVVTDILILKKRADRTEYAGEAFEASEWERVGTGWEGAYVNEYFVQHPEMVLGTPKLARGMYTANELTYDPFTDRGSLGDQIRDAIKNIQGKMDYSVQPSAEKENFRQASAKKKSQKLQVKDGVIHARDENGNLTKVDVDKDTAARITGMVAIRDAHVALCDALQQGVKKQEITKLRKALNNAYDSFVEKYGYLNAPKNKKAIKAFADQYAILSLENYSTEGKKVVAKKSDIFTKDTIAANRTASSAETVEEGLTISLNTVGHVDVGMIARLTGQKVENVTRQLIDQRLVFKDKDGNLIPAVQYLSGNVRAKLREMEGLVGIDRDYQNNVEALREVVPPTVQHTDIYVNPGANWVPVEVYEDFVGYILKRYNHESYRTGKKDFAVEYVPETNEYKVVINDAYAKMSAQNTQVWGEGGKPFSTIFENMLNGRRTNVYMDNGDGTRVLDKAKTEAVAEKVEKLNEEFRKWLWEDESRRSEMQELYNETYNALVTPKYSGESLTVNGLNATYELKPHQKDAVARIINSGGNTLLAHRVGAGKTMEMAAAAMKLKQLGVIKKPMFVVPNNVVAQWGMEFKDYFPAANILVIGDEDMTPAERMTTINKIKNNDYDAVILAATKFEKIQMTTAWRQKFYEEQIESIMFALNAEKESKGGKGFTVKQLENKRKQLEARLKKLTDKAKDEDGAMFEDLGVDALFVDEAHNYKNLEYSTRMTNVSGLGKAEGAQRSFDLYTKVRYLQQLNGGRGVVFATATPVMNSMTEMYIMQKYLQPDTLKQLGIEHFDSWAKMFGEVVNALEIAPSGSGYRLKQTFSKFKNVKALQQLFRSFTDVLTDVPGLKIPKMKGRKVQIVECEQGEFQKNYMEELAQRAENVKNVDPTEDNMLKITSDGRKISYSQRMIDPSLPYEETGKIYRCCDNVYEVYLESNATKGTQMIFCDMATPKGKSSSKTDADANTDEFASVDVESAQLYDDMKSRLVQLGIPEKEIAFIHDAKNDKQKGELSEKMNNGTIRVLIGSTGKMGVGLNAQKKAVAIHHLDAPWRPGDIEQRDGRVFRQKNENEEAYKFVYVTRGSFDSRLWDILERKQKFINQVMNGEDVGNEIEDTGEVTLSAAEVKAVASDNPLIMEQVALEKEISKLQSLQQAHQASVSRAEEKIVIDRRNIANLENLISNVQTDMQSRKDTYSSEKVFSIQIGNQTFTDKKDAGAALVAAAEAHAKEGEYIDIGKFAGFTLRVVKTNEGVKGQVYGSGSYEFKTYPLNPTFGINHLVSVVEGLEERLAIWSKNLSEAKSDLETQKQLAAEPFEQAEKLKEKRARYNEVMYILNPPADQHISGEDVQEQSRDYLDDTQEQQRTDTLTDREVLALAASQVKVSDMTDAEKDALDIFQKRLSKLEALQDERAEQGRLYKEQQFGTKVDRAAAAETLNRMHVLDGQIQKASEEVLTVEEKKVLKRVLQKARTVVEQQERQHGQEILKRWRDRRNDADAIKKYRDRLRGDVDELTNWVLHPDNKNVVKHIPDALKNTVIPFLSSINFMSKRSLAGGNPTQADKALMEQTRRLAKVMENTVDIDEMYSNYTDLPPDFMKNLRSFIDTAQGIVDNNSGDFIINQMTAEELKTLSKVVRTLKKYIMQMNRFHVNSMFKHVYEAGENSIDFLEELKPAENTGSVSQFVLWQQMRPAYAFERFGDGGMAVYDGLRRGQATLAFNTKKIMEFSEKAYTTAEVKAWENEVKTIRIGPGRTVKMRVSQIMSLYELNKREQAQGHIFGEGIRVATFKNGKQKISDVGQTLTPGELNLILRELTPRQKEVADNLQQFMQNQGGEWGNYVTVARFGEKQFGEENYFPINSDGRHLQVDADEKPGASALYALLNMSFTKQTQEKTKNRLIVYSIFDVFSNHMASMAQYNAFALPVVDALKWFNYQRVDIDEDGTKTILGSVREEMDRAFGVPEENRPGSGRRGYAQNFVIGIIKALNGTEAQGTAYDSWGLQTLHNYNRAQVAYNLRVVVQQPLAITRAAQLLDYGSIIKGMKLKPAAIQKNIQEMQQYSGIAAWKSLGFYDVNISRGLTSIIKHDDTALDKVTDVGMWGAEKADTLTWAAIWSACKEEVIRKQKLTPNSEGFYEAVTKLFEDVIYKTQVVDSVLTKNEFMRDKGFWARAVGSFMSEPTTTASMLVDAYDKYHMDLQRGMTRQQAWKKNSKMIVRTAYVYGLGAAILAAVQAVADAFRDDDDYQKWYEKWLEAFGGNLVDELMPFNKLPLVSDFYDLAKELLSIFGVDTYGNPPQSVFMQWYDSLVKGVKIVYGRITGEEERYTWYGGAYKLLQAASGMTGLPMASATREIVTAWNNIVGGMAPSLKVKTYDPGEKNSIKYAYQDGYLTAEEAKEQLLKYGLVDTEDEAHWTVQGWEAGDGYSRYDAIFDAVRNGGDFNAAMIELTSHGYTEKDILSQVKGEIGKWYKDGQITKQQAINMLTKYMDMDSDEITSTVNKWSCKVVTGMAFEDIKNEFLSGNITAARAIEMRMRYGGETKEEAQNTIGSWKFEAEHPELDVVITYTQYKRWETDGKPNGVSLDIFADVAKFRNDGTSDSAKSQEEVAAYINALNISTAQKDALWCCFWKKTTLKNAPWH